MSPAKIFACMKERESKAEQQEVRKVSSSTRDLFGGCECVTMWKDLNPVNRNVSAVNEWWSGFSVTFMLHAVQQSCYKLHFLHR